MSLAVYKILHLLGLALAMLGLGGVALHALNGGDRDSNGKRGLVAGMHGTGMLLLIVAGFGMLAKSGAGMPGWVHPKLLIWLFLGAAYPLLNRKPKLALPILIALPLLVVAAAYFGIYKGA
jgi:hypothetical protein